MTTNSLWNPPNNLWCLFVSQSSGGLSGKFLAPGGRANPGLADPAAFTRAASAMICALALWITPLTAEKALKQSSQTHCPDIALCQDCSDLDSFITEQ